MVSRGHFYDSRLERVTYSTLRLFSPTLSLSHSSLLAQGVVQQMLGLTLTLKSNVRHNGKAIATGVSTLERLAVAEQALRTRSAVSHR